MQATCSGVLGPLFKVTLIGHAKWCTRHRVIGFVLVYAQCRARNSAAILILSYPLPAVHGDDVIMPPVIAIFPWAR